jgi:hypothetical protein
MIDDDIPWMVLGGVVLAAGAVAVVWFFTATAPAPQMPMRPAVAVAPTSQVSRSITRVLPESAPASRPATRPVPAERLADATQQRARELQRRLSDDFHVLIAPPYVVAGNMGGQDVRGYLSRTIARCSRAMAASYFDKTPTEPITILLFTDAASYRAWAKELYGDEGVAPFGYYRPSQRTMLMDISTGTGTLVHELTHALMAFDFSDAPLWFAEGLASLHEQCEIHDDRLVGRTNWRLPALKAELAAGRLRPLGQLIVPGGFRGGRVGLNYAHARYFTMYMQQQWKLRAFYARFREHHGGPTAGMAAVEHVFGKPLAKVDAEFRAWLTELEYSP